MSKILTRAEAGELGYEVRDEPQEMRLLSLSTSHVDGDDRLVQWTLSGEHPRVISTDRGDGWLVLVEKNLPPYEYRPELQAADVAASVIDVLVLACQLGCDYVLLDRDAPCLACLPIYAW